MTGLYFPTLFYRKLNSASIVLVLEKQFAFFVHISSTSQQINLFDLANLGVETVLLNLQHISSH